MQVYKAYFKIIYKNLSQIMIYITVFLTLAVVMANTNNNVANISFTETKVNMVFINNDGDSRLVKGLEAYLSKQANIVHIPDETQKLQDALFFREVEYILRVPKGFTEGLLSGRALQLEKTTAASSASGVYIDNIINKYLNTAKTYLANIEDLSAEQLLSYVENDLSQKTEVIMNHSVEEGSKNEKSAIYFNYVAYSLLSILILGVSSVMLVFNNTDIKKRNLCSPIKLRSMNFQLILGNLSYAFIAWFIMILTSLMMYGSYMFSVRGMLLLLNSLIFTIAALSISFLIANVIKSRNAMSAAANVLSLGTCFISGVFVPQALLGEKVLRAASFTPNYWYVKSNNSIANLVNFNMENLAPIFLNMLIIVGFAVAVFSVTLVVTKQKRMSN
jgi:ABC-2 type transport system permease protein